MAHHEALFPMVTGLWGGTGRDCTKALICANEDAPVTPAPRSHPVPASGAQVPHPPTPPPNLKGGRLLCNWPRGGPGTPGKPLIGCLILSRCTLHLTKCAFPASYWLTAWAGREFLPGNWVSIRSRQSLGGGRGATRGGIGCGGECDWSGCEPGVDWCGRAAGAGLRGPTLGPRSGEAAARGRRRRPLG